MPFCVAESRLMYEDGRTTSLPSTVFVRILTSLGCIAIRLFEGSGNHVSFLKLQNLS